MAMDRPLRNTINLLAALKYTPYHKILAKGRLCRPNWRGPAGRGTSGAHFAHMAHFNRISNIRGLLRLLF